jgi:hypothetical protein
MASTRAKISQFETNWGKTNQAVLLYMQSEPVKEGLREKASLFSIGQIEKRIRNFP